MASKNLIERGAQALVAEWVERISSAERRYFGQIAPAFLKRLNDAIDREESTLASNWVERVNVAEKRYVEVVAPDLRERLSEAIDAVVPERGSVHSAIREVESMIKEVRKLGEVQEKQRETQQDVCDSLERAGSLMAKFVTCVQALEQQIRESIAKVHMLEDHHSKPRIGLNDLRSQGIVGRVSTQWLSSASGVVDVGEGASELETLRLPAIPPGERPARVPRLVTLIIGAVCTGDPVKRRARMASALQIGKNAEQIEKSAEEGDAARYPYMILPELTRYL